MGLAQHFMYLVKDTLFCRQCAGHILELDVPNILDDENLTQDLESAIRIFGVRTQMNDLNMLND